MECWHFEFKAPWPSHFKAQKIFYSNNISIVSQLWICDIESLVSCDQRAASSIRSEKCSICLDYFNKYVLFLPRFFWNTYNLLHTSDRQCVRSHVVSCLESGDISEPSEDVPSSRCVQSMSSAGVCSLFGSKETSLDWRPRGQEMADHVTTAVQWISGPLNDLLKGQKPCDQSAIDLMLR